MRQTKTIFFQDKIDEHKDNSKQLWNQFQTLGYSHKNKEKLLMVLEIENENCFNNKNVANHMNGFYLTIASTLQSQIYNVRKIYETSSPIF